MMIKLMDRGFALVAIALSFGAGNGDRSGDELSIVESPILPGRYFRGHYDTCSHDMRASTGPPPQQHPSGERVEECLRLLQIERGRSVR
jgi:hypothetical protein